jgi:hypothetical protein
MTIQRSLIQPGQVRILIREQAWLLLISKEFQLSRHAGMDCRHPQHMGMLISHHPWPLGSGNPCRNDGLVGWLKILSNQVATDRVYNIGYNNPVKLLAFIETLEKSV